MDYREDFTINVETRVCNEIENAIVETVKPYLPLEIEFQVNANMIAEALKNKNRYEKLLDLCINEELLGEWFCDMMCDIEYGEWCSKNCSGSTKRECVDKWMELSGI